MRFGLQKMSGVALSVLATMGLTASAQAASPAAPRIDWQRCSGADPSETLRCGQLSVPIDWSRPGTSPRTTVDVARLPAADPEHRIGTLFFNPGGPGDGEVGYLRNAQAREQYFPQRIRDRFDIVAVEPRGTGINPPLNCPSPVDLSVSRFPTDRSAAAALVRSNRHFAKDCAQGTGPLFAHLDTGSIARDMDAVRTALGERTVSFLGLSYGTMVAQSYAELYPARVRAMVVDGVVDRSLTWRRMAEIDAAAVEDGVGRFARWSDENAQSPLHGQDVHDLLTSLLHRADDGEIKDADRRVRAEEIAQAVNTGLQTPKFYEMLATALRKTADGADFTPLAPFTSAENPEYAAYRSIICQDIPGPADAEATLPAAVRQVREAGPTLRGYSEFWDIASGCAGWPVNSPWKPHTWQVPTTFPPVLLLSGAHDVATPPPFAEQVRRTLPTSKLLRWNTDGHTAWHNSPTTVDAAVDYLTTLRMPEAAR
ncbi:alpha/beta hydrolase [Streptomyces sp. NPDC057555]|uniref:alpha/beta hydrolase n=1 Tax=Streptomyces sp. NPDC057555 TaxID=3346166 RepID=UPI0036B26D65